MNSSMRLDSLTSLRFIAAALIVVHHSRGYFGIPSDFLLSVPLSQGVSFFFVLSGFILTYVHPELNSREERGRFLLARIARIWPAHAATFLLIVILIPFSLRDHGIGLAILNLLMLQSWVPVQWSIYSFNGPAWSISTELFFYICFPMLIYRWKQTWFIKFVLVSIVVLSILAAVHYFHIPAVVSRKTHLSLLGLVYTNPAVRIFEFVLGMCIALLYRVAAHKVSTGFVGGTAIEVIALVAVVSSFVYMPLLAKMLTSQPAFWSAGRTLIENASCAPAFALLIGVISLERGFISYCLKLPFAVLLGEISYSVYMFHEVLIRFIKYKWPAFSDSTMPMTFVAFAALLIVIAYLSWYFIEKPARKYINGLWPDSTPGGVANRRFQLKTILSFHDSFKRLTMRQVAIYTLGCLLFAFLVCELTVPSPPSSTRNYTVQWAPEIEANNIKGEWMAFGSLARISIAGDNLLKIQNESNLTASGKISGNVLEVAEWGVAAMLSMDRRVLFWSNGVIWEKSDCGAPDSHLAN
jgi:peptidoglycan/LPS O-acetylase OafA/YrhL